MAPAALTVTDVFNGGSPTPLGAEVWNVATTTFPTYTRTVAVPAELGCVEYSNTATITERSQSASQTVTVCNTDTGARTIGFWQNRNGQDIIKTGAATAGVCNSGTWLR